MFWWFPAFLELMNTFTISIRMWDFMGTQIFVYLGLQFIRSCQAVACDSGSSQRRPRLPASQVCAAAARRLDSRRVLEPAGAAAHLRRVLLCYWSVVLGEASAEAVPIFTGLFVFLLLGVSSMIRIRALCWACGRQMPPGLWLVSSSP